MSACQRLPLRLTVPTILVLSAMALPALAAQVFGEVTRHKQVQVEGEDRSNLVVMVSPPQGPPVGVDLGRAEALPSRDLQGRQLRATGEFVRIGDRAVLMAEVLELDGQPQPIARTPSEEQAIAQLAESQQQVGPRQRERQISGRVTRTKEVAIPGADRRNRVATVQTDGGEKVIVDLGPADRIRADEIQGQPIDVQGRVARIGDRLIIVADRYGTGTDRMVTVDRPGTPLARNGRMVAGTETLMVSEAIVGKRVENDRGQHLGTVDDLLAGSGGFIHYLLVSPAEGIDPRGGRIAVPWHAVEAIRDDGVVVPMERANFADAPRFAPDTEAGRDWHVEAHRFFGLTYVPPTFSALDRNGDGTLSRREFSAFEQRLETGVGVGGLPQESPSPRTGTDAD